MDIDKYLKPEFDFSGLGPIERELLGDVTEEELSFAPEKCEGGLV
jgi:hypothetical protein